MVVSEKLLDIHIIHDQRLFRIKSNDRFQIPEKRRCRYIEADFVSPNGCVAHDPSLSA
ncbi:protein of unknown function [Methylocaldum szegediense]|uniref:Uncharacterized protein n=1 Tax=Methylocaldum szegediense TaxID=73780 RepID=A0ABM9I134_9GAMM|nr:protein of unknown function [Methylocaldum szegediense]